LSKIIAIGTAVPEHCHRQENIPEFMQRVYALDEAGKRKLKYLYRQSGIDYRYSVIPDYSLPATAWQFYSPTENLEPFPGMEKRMEWYKLHAASLSRDAIQRCVENFSGDITHLITVSCTGMSAPGLELELLESLQLPATIFHTSINFMGCYAAIHALKMADAICKNDKNANVVMVCTELCTLHFQKENSIDNITSTLLFGDGSAAVLIQHDETDNKGLFIKSFSSQVAFRGKKDMSWQLSSKGFLMALSGYVPDLVKEDFNALVQTAVKNASLSKDDITHWCIHPGGKKILEAIQKSAGLSNDNLQYSFDVLREYGNMSSPTILFVLERVLTELLNDATSEHATVFTAAFGPGLTMETFIATYD